MVENRANPLFLSSLVGTLMLVSKVLSLFVKYFTQYPIKLSDFPLSTFHLKHYQPSPEMMNLSKGGLPTTAGWRRKIADYKILGSFLFLGGKNTNTQLIIL